MLAKKIVYLFVNQKKIKITKHLFFYLYLLQYDLFKLSMDCTCDTLAL